MIYLEIYYESERVQTKFEHVCSTAVTAYEVNIVKINNKRALKHIKKNIIGTHQK